MCSDQEGKAALVLTVVISITFVITVEVAKFAKCTASNCKAKIAEYLN